MHGKRGEKLELLKGLQPHLFLKPGNGLWGLEGLFGFECRSDSEQIVETDGDFYAIGSGQYQTSSCSVLFYTTAYFFPTWMLIA